MSRRFIRIGLIAITALVIAAGIVWFQAPGKDQSLNSLKPLAGDNFGGAFTLTDHNGNEVTDQDFTGQYRLIYFGFTFCPAICPTELQKMTTALNMLGPVGEDIQPIFITIDPERDTAETMNQYVQMFHPDLVGLTGTPEQIEQAAKAYKVYYAKVDDPDMTEYTMDHSSYIYFIDPQDRLLALYKIDQTAEEMAENMGAWLKQNADQSSSGS